MNGTGWAELNKRLPFTLYSYATKFSIVLKKLPTFDINKKFYKLCSFVVSCQFMLSQKCNLNIIKIKTVHLLLRNDIWRITTSIPVT